MCGPGSCVCGVPFSANEAYICCDGCRIWFHFRCVGLRADSEHVGTWNCPSCLNGGGVNCATHPANIAKAALRAAGCRVIYKAGSKKYEIWNPDNTEVAGSIRDAAARFLPSNRSNAALSLTETAVAKKASSSDDGTDDNLAFGQLDMLGSLHKTAAPRKQTTKAIQRDPLGLSAAALQESIGLAPIIPDKCLTCPKTIRDFRDKANPKQGLNNHRPNCRKHKATAAHLIIVRGLKMAAVGRWTAQDIAIQLNVSCRDLEIFIRAKDREAVYCTEPVCLLLLSSFFVLRIT